MSGPTYLKAAHGLIPVEPEDPTLPDWEFSKSKTATNLDGNYKSQVTLSLPAAQETLASDVVFVLDKSTSATVEDQMISMLNDLNEQAKATGRRHQRGRRDLQQGRQHRPAPDGAECREHGRYPEGH